MSCSHSNASFRQNEVFSYTIAIATIGKVLSKYFRTSQPPEEFCEKGVLKNLGNFTGKHCAGVSFQKGLSKRSSNRGVFMWNFWNFKNTCFEKHLRTTASNTSKGVIKLLFKDSAFELKSPLKNFSHTCLNI